MDEKCFEESMVEVMTYTGVRYHNGALMDLWKYVQGLPNAALARAFSALTRNHNEGCRLPLAAIEGLILSAGRALEAEKERVRVEEWNAAKAEDRRTVLKMPPEVKQAVQQVLGKW